VKDVSGTANDVSGIAKDVTGVKKDLVERKLAEKHLTDEESLVSKPTLEDVKRFDPKTKQIVRAADIVEDLLARKPDLLPRPTLVVRVGLWLEEHLRVITSLFVLIVLFLCLWYIVKTVLHME
jgi:hypothetical protein